MTKKYLAQLISRIFDPAVLAIVILLVAIGRSEMTSLETVVWFAVILFLNGLIPYLFLIYFTDKGYVFDDVLGNKQILWQRTRLFVVFLFIVALELLISLLTKQYEPLLAVFTGGLVSISLALVVTQYWKISMHSALVTFFVAMLVLLYGYKVWPFALFVPAVFWSRLTLKRHTLAQLLAGALLATLVVVSTFVVFKQL